MISSYQSVYREKCEACGRLTKGGKGELPGVRRRVRVFPEGEKGKGAQIRRGTVDLSDSATAGGVAEGKEGKEGKERTSKKVESLEELQWRWVAYHEGCFKLAGSN